MKKPSIKLEFLFLDNSEKDTSPTGVLQDLLLVLSYSTIRVYSRRVSFFFCALPLRCVRSSSCRRCCEEAVPTINGRQWMGRERNREKGSAMMLKSTDLTGRSVLACGNEIMPKPLVDCPTNCSGGWPNFRHKCRIVSPDPEK
eukprot:scaffold4239_cov156-Amphora_coffeaeformis.AAC.4